MERLNAFMGHPDTPTEREVEAALGSAAALWHELLAWAHANGAQDGEWKCTSLKHGWSYRLKQKQRNILYMSPCQGCVRIAFVLSDRALTAAKAAHLPQRIVKELQSAPRYPEGNGIRLILEKHTDLPAIQKIAQIKMSN